jgi:hypothetical protein
LGMDRPENLSSFPPSFWRWNPYCPFNRCQDIFSAGYGKSPMS